MSDSCLSHLFLSKIRNYEDGIFRKIKSKHFYEFEDNYEFRTGINLWFEDRFKCIKKYVFIR